MKNVIELRYPNRFLSDPPPERFTIERRVSTNHIDYALTDSHGCYILRLQANNGWGRVLDPGLAAFETASRAIVPANSIITVRKEYDNATS